MSEMHTYRVLGVSVDKDPADTSKPWIVSIDWNNRVIYQPNSTEDMLKLVNHFLEELETQRWKLV